MAYCWRRLKLRSLLPESVPSRSLRRKLDEHSSDSITLGSANQCVDWLRRFAENRLADLCGGRRCRRCRSRRDRKFGVGGVWCAAGRRHGSRLLLGARCSAREVPGTPKGVPVDADGCPVAAPPAPVVEEVVVVKEETIVIRDVHFQFDKATLTPSDKLVLDKVATRLKQESSTARLTVTGHTDSVGSDAYNQKLSDKRAHSVVEYLIHDGVPRSSFVSVTGKGESQPVADNKTADGRALNRRTEIKIER